MTDYGSMSTEELKEKYHELVDEGAKKGSVGMSFGNEVMELSAIKSELRDRGEWERR